MRFSSGMTNRRSITQTKTGSSGSDDAQANFTADDVAGGALAAWVGTGNDGFVATLFDQSGQAQHVTQDIASAQPVIVSDGLMVVENGAPALDFTGGRYLSRGSGNSLDYSGNFLNVFSVNRHDGTGSTDRLLSDDKVGVQGYFLLRPKFSTTMTINDGTGYKFGGAPLAYTGQTVLTLLFDGSSGEGRFFLKGAVQDVFTTAPWAGGIGSSGEAGFAIGSGADGGQTWAGTQQELIVFTTDQSANRGGIEQNIADHYGITL